MHVTGPCQRRTSYINRSLCLPIREAYGSPHCSAFLIGLVEQLLLSSIPCCSCGTKWKILLPFALLQSFLVIRAFRGVSSGAVGCPSGSFVSCTRSIYLKLTSPSFQQDVSDVGVWSALGNWSQSCLGLLKGSVKPCIRPSCQWGTSEEKEDRLACSLWSVSLGRRAAVIWNSCKCDLNTAEAFDWSVSVSGWLLSAVLHKGEMVQSREGIPRQQWMQKEGSKSQLIMLTYIMRYFASWF